MYPIQTETAQIVATKLLQELVPSFGLPVAMGFDNGLAFITQNFQLIAKVLGIDWKLYVQVIVHIDLRVLV